MNIVHTIFSQGLAGSECYCADLANWQAAQGHTVTVVIRPQRENINITVHLAPRVQVVTLGKLCQKRRMQRLVRTYNPAIIHTHLGKASKLIGNMSTPCPTVATLHMGYNKPKIYSKMNGLISLTERDKNRISAYNGAITRVWNWYMPPQQEHATKPVRAVLNIPDDAYVFGTVARIHPQKGIEGLVQAFIDVHDKAKAACKPHLIIVGGGEKGAVEALRKQVRAHPHIHCIGPVDNTAPYYNAMNCFILNSREELFGLVLLEAMHHGLPIITTQTEGPSEFIGDQPVSFIPIGGTQALEDAMQKHYKQPQSPVLYNMKNYNRDTQCRHIMGFYEELTR